MRYGYARDSALGRGLEYQVEALEGSGIEPARIFADGADATENDRPGYEDLMSRLVEGDSITVTSFARIVRSPAKLLALGAELEARGVGLVSIEERIDTTSPQGGYFFAAARAFHEIGRSITREVQAEGIAVAKGKGVAFGNRKTDPAKLDRAIALHAAGGKTLDQVAAEAGISVSTLLRELKARGR